MKGRFVLFIALLIGLESCKKNDDPTTGQVTSTTKTLFTANIASDYSDGTSNWAVFHDSTGRCLGYRSFQNGGTVTYDSNGSLPGNMITVTLIAKRTGSVEGVSYPFYDINTYANVNTGDVWTVSTPFFKSPNNVSDGSFSVQFNYANDGGGLPKIVMSDPNGNEFTSQYSPEGYLIQCTMYNGATDFYLTVKFGDGSIKQKLFSNVKNLDSYTVDTDDLVAPDKLATIPLPNGSYTYQFSVSGVQSGQTGNSGFVLDDEGYPGVVPTTVTGAYPSALNDFTTNLFAAANGNGFYYYNHGSIPSNFVWPDPSKINLITATLGSFKSTSSVPVLFVNTGYQYSSGVITNAQWDVWSSSISQKLKSFPSDLLRAEPDLAFNLYKKSYSIFYVQSTVDYQQFLGNQFKGATNPAVVEHYGIGY